MTIEDKLANLDHECLVYSITKHRSEGFLLEFFLSTKKSTHSPCCLRNYNLNLHNVVDEALDLIYEHKQTCKLH